ncbi:TRAP transporter substrate-binding protein DctP [Desulfocastanea catecholica]
MKYLPLLSALLVLQTLLALGHTAAAGLPVMRISVENTATHVETQAVSRFASALQEKLQDRIDVQFYPDAQLFRDKDVVQALGQGKIEMAIPGTWHLAAHEPSVGIFLLPCFYGRPAEVNYHFLAGEIGRAINERIEKRLPVIVLGRWIDLGHAHLFSMEKKIRRHEDIHGLRIRVAGGVANELRISALGGIPASIAWPDLPEYMRQGKIDAVLTSYETIESAGLENKGIRYAFEDSQYFPQYVPLVRGSFWRKLSPEIQDVIRQTWEAQVDSARAEAAAAQSKAKKALLEKGMEIVVPESAELEVWRKKLSVTQDDFVRAMHIDPALVEKMVDICQSN